VPKIAPARPDAHAPRGTSASETAAGWCLPCYEAGSCVLAVDTTLSLCVVHAQVGPSGPQSDAGADGSPTSASGAQRRSRPPRGRAARPPGGRPQAGPWVGLLTAARRRARGMAYGRRRAAVRVAAGRYDPHPGWRHLIAPQYRVLVEQAEALAVVEELVDAQEWRSDKRAAWAAILRRLVCSMDWQTGLITAVTLDRLGDAGARAPRTVSRVIAWARDAGLLVVVEHGASAAFLGTEHGRTPSYALVTTRPAPANPADDTDPPGEQNPQVTAADHTNGDLPVSYVDQKPLSDERLEPATPVEQQWPSWQIPQTAAQRIAATRCLFRHLGLDDRGVSGRVRNVRIPLWRAVRQLRPWWDGGLSPRGLLHAIHHLPGQPGHSRGDALRGAHQPLAVLGARLSPWRDRLHELPGAVIGHRTLHDAVSAERPVTEPTPPAAPAGGSAGRTAPPSWRPWSSSTTRDAARALLDNTLRQRARSGAHDVRAAPPPPP